MKIIKIEGKNQYLIGLNLEELEILNNLLPKDSEAKKHITEAMLTLIFIGKLVEFNSIKKLN